MPRHWGEHRGSSRLRADLESALPRLESGRRWVASSSRNSTRLFGSNRGKCLHAENRRGVAYLAVQPGGCPALGMSHNLHIVWDPKPRIVRSHRHFTNTHTVVNCSSFLLILKLFEYRFWFYKANNNDGWGVEYKSDYSYTHQTNSRPHAFPISRRETGHAWVERQPCRCKVGPSPESGNPGNRALFLFFLVKIVALQGLVACVLPPARQATKLVNASFGIYMLQKAQLKSTLRRLVFK